MEKIGTKPNKKLKIAVTGGIGSGKTSVSLILREMGYPVFSCDEIYKNLQTNSDYLNSLKKIFPTAVQNGVLNKQELSNIVFFDTEQLKKLNALAHPLIMQRLYSYMEQYSVSFAEVPLLFECGAENQFDEVIVVYRSLSERIKAVCERDNLSEEKVLSRIKNQVNYEKIIQEGHTVIYNDGNFLSLKKKVCKALEKILI